ncbi:MAG: TonB-dependent receptor plug domain-containing protein, partial [Rhizomicrobium sp.]
MTNRKIGVQENSQGLTALKRVLVATAAITALGAGLSDAYAQSADTIETIVITGYRASLESALATKRMSNSMVDAINAEDVAKFPDANLAESLQRLPGVSVDMDNGEGRTISIRGLGADFTRVTINGMEALSTAGSSNAGTNPNRSRQFDFNTFASELFSSLKVTKSPSAETDEGSLGATIGLVSGHPFEIGNKVALSANNAYYEQGHAFNPRVAAVLSHNWLGGRLGTLFSMAYNIRHQSIDSFSSGVGMNYVYSAVGTAAMTFAGTPNPASGSTIMTRDGFAAPTGTSCSGTSGVIPGATITNSAYCAALSGSDPDAYAAVEGTNYGHTINSSGTWVGSAPINALLLPQLRNNDLYQNRIGLTSSIQWQVDDNTLITIDGLFSSYHQNATNYYLTDIGFNRNNTVSGLTSATSSTNLSSYYATCADHTETAIQAANTCVTSSSMSVYDYYSNSSSPGYDSSDPNGLNHLIATIGRPTTKILSATVTNNVVGAITLDNMDYRSFTDQSIADTQFEQGSAHLEHAFTDNLKMDFLFGMAVSRNKQVGTYVSFDTLDRGTASGDSTFSYTTSGSKYTLQDVSYGFDVADVNNWGFIKGYSDIRRFMYETVNKHKNIATNWSYTLFDELTLRTGFAARNYDFNTSRATRVVSTTWNPALDEAGISVADVSRSVSFDAKSVGLGENTPTRFIAPDIGKFEKYLGLDCNCVNEYGDWRISTKNSVGSSANVTTNFGVSEHDRSYYLQADFNGIDLLGIDIRGNLGLRYATTGVKSTGYAYTGYMTSATNDYDDMLPSIN